MFDKYSLSQKIWQPKNHDERLELYLSQKFQISIFLSKLLILRNINETNINEYLKPNLKYTLPNPFLLKDMNKSINRLIKAIQNKEKIGIIADYDVDGSTSAGILYNFLYKFTSKLILKIPHRLIEGYGPNIRIMDEMKKEKVSLLFTLDCGTTAFEIIDNSKYSKIDTIIIDHHLSETFLPKVYSIINPNRYDESNNFNQMAAVGVTFLFLMALRKKMREKNFFNIYKEPNLLNYLDLVALGTICDVVKLTDYNRIFVKKGMELIKNRKHIAISKMIDSSKINYEPSSLDLAFTIGPKLNAASRVGDSSLASKFLIEKDINELEIIAKKLNLLNEKRKLIEEQIFEKAVKQAEKQKDSNYVLVYGEDWHNGVLGIIASRIINIYNKPTIVISFNNKLGVGSARSIKNIDLGQLILNAKNINILDSGGGHSMAAGLKINKKNLNQFIIFLDTHFTKYKSEFFSKIEYYDTDLSVNQLNEELLEIIEQMEPYGSGNPEPIFFIKDLKIENIKIIKEKHILLFFKNDFGNNYKGISFNCINTKIGDYLINYNKFKFNFICSIKKDNYSDRQKLQIIILDVFIIN